MSYNIHAQMQEEAEAIVPGIKLKALCNLTRRDHKQRMALGKLATSGNLYFSPSYLSECYAISRNSLEACAKQYLKIRP